MTIAEAREKCKSLLGRVPRDVLIIAVLILASTLSFGLGYLAGQDTGQGSNIIIGPSTTAFVASKSGTKYYLPSCPGVEHIEEANKVWFISADAAQAQGYSPAANCDGL